MTVSTKEILLTAGDRIVDASPVGVIAAEPTPPEAFVNAPVSTSSNVDAIEPRYNIRVIGYGKLSERSDFSNDIYKRLADILSITEDMIVWADRNSILLDETYCTELYTASVSKSVAEVISLVESFVKTSGVNKEDATAIVEALSSHPEKMLSDAVLLSETLVSVMAFAMQPSESVLLTETISSATSKVMTDLATLSETLSLVASYIRTFEEATQIVEMLANDVTRPLPMESVIVSEIGFEFTLGRLQELFDALLISESIKADVGKNIVETMTPIEYLSNNVSRPFTENMSFIEAFSLTPIKAYMDSITLSESGTIQHNDYVDVTYLVSDDYVNTKYYF